MTVDLSGQEESLERSSTSNEPARCVGLTQSASWTLRMENRELSEMAMGESQSGAQYRRWLMIGLR